MLCNELGISIIVPVYNAGDRFKPSLESLLSQTLDHSCYEIILVDDGSTDDSGSICDEYAKNYPGLVRTFHQEASGHCSAPRNKGIDEARGEYLFFHDADDIMLPEACERMLNHAREWNSDVLVVRECMRWPDGTIKPITSYASDNKPSIPSVNTYADFLVSDMDARRLVRRSLVLENNLRFEETLSEEYLFCQKSLYYAKVISLANDYTYEWYMQWEEGNISSSGHQSPVKTFDGRMYGIKEMLRFIDEKNAREIAYPYLYKKIFEHPVYRLMSTSMDQRNWEEESPRLGELRDAIAGHWDDCIADKVKFTERAVIETLMAKSFSSIPAIRNLGKRPAGGRKEELA